MHRRAAVLSLWAVLLVAVPATSFAKIYNLNVTVTNSDPTQAGRIVRSNIASSCQSDKICPGVFDSTPRHYQTISIFNDTKSPSCVGITNPPAASNLYWVAYYDSFDPNNLCANFAGDTGTSDAGSVHAAGLTVPPLTTLVVVVHELTPNAGGSAMFNINLQQVPPRAGFLNEGGANNTPAAVLRNPTTGENAALLVGANQGNFNNRPKVSIQGIPDTNWHIGGVGFFGGTTGTDIAWHNVSTGKNAFWIMNYASLVTVQNLPGIPNTAIDMVGSSDFDHNGTMDLLWRNSANGNDAIWLMNGPSVSAIVNLPGVPDTNWTIVGAEDFDLDAWPDIVWYNTVTGDLAIWKMNGTNYVSTANVAGVPNLSWRPKALMDANGDGAADIIWENVTVGQMTAWVMNRFAIASVDALNTGEPKEGRVVVGPR